MFSHFSHPCWRRFLSKRHSWRLWDKKSQTGTVHVRLTTDGVNSRWINWVPMGFYFSLTFTGSFVFPHFLLGLILFWLNPVSLVLAGSQDVIRSHALKKHLQMYLSVTKYIYNPCIDPYLKWIWMASSWHFLPLTSNPSDIQQQTW